jgi:hypothetical protein
MDDMGIHGTQWFFEEDATRSCLEEGQKNKMMWENLRK